jgi:hypothetical protein
LLFGGLWEFELCCNVGIGGGKMQNNISHFPLPVPPALKIIKI